MQKVIDQIFCYPRGKMPGREGFCRIRVFNSDRRYVVITNINDSPGSVTMDIEKIISELNNSGLIAQHTKIIEHYEKGNDFHSFDLVQLIDGRPKWKEISQERVVDMLQCCITEFDNMVSRINHFMLQISLLSRAVNSNIPICECNSTWRKSRLLVFCDSLSDLVSNGATEREIQNFIKNSDNLDCFAQYYARPTDEYIAFSELPIGDKIADFVILSGRSRLEVDIIEIKGSDFDIIQSSGGQYFREQINSAISQIDCHRAHISMNLYQNYKFFHNIIRSVLSGKNIHNSHVGSKKQLFVDPDKDVLFHYHVIGGISKNDLYESQIRHTREASSSNLSIDSWDSFLKKLR